MYRALTLKAMDLMVNFEDEKTLVKIAANSKIELLPDSSNNLRVLLDGSDVFAYRHVMNPRIGAHCILFAERLVLKTSDGTSGSCIRSSRPNSSPYEDLEFRRPSRPTVVH